jgi:hypothetical protein
MFSKTFKTATLTAVLAASLSACASTGNRQGVESPDSPLAGGNQGLSSVSSESSPSHDSRAASRPDLSGFERRAPRQGQLHGR